MARWPRRAKVCKTRPLNIVCIGIPNMYERRTDHHEPHGAISKSPHHTLDGGRLDVRLLNPRGTMSSAVLDCSFVTLGWLGKGDSLSLGLDMSAPETTPHRPGSRFTSGRVAASTLGTEADFGGIEFLEDRHTRLRPSLMALGIPKDIPYTEPRRHGLSRRPT